MKLGIRGKLFLWTLLLVAAVDLAVGLYLGNELRRDEQEQIQARLLHHAHAMTQLLEVGGDEGDIAVIDDLADRMGEAVGARVTVIDQSGAVLGDSELTVAEVRDVENHGSRPEVLDALNHGMGVSQRHSDTLDLGMLYLAVPWDRRAGRGVVRVAASLEQIDASLARLRAILLLAGVVAVALSALVGVVASSLVSRTLQSVVSTVHRIAEGDVREAKRLPSHEELEGLVGSVSRLARDLQDTVADLARERDRLAAVLQGMQEGLIAVDESGHVTLVNRAATDLLRLPASVEGRPLLESVRIPALAELIDRTRTDGPSTAEFSLPGTSSTHLLAHATPHERDGGVVVIFHDVSEIRRLERIRSDFVANVSHELRTPVSIIRANAETLLDGALEHPEQAERFLKALLRSSDRLGRLVGDLLDISRIEAGKYSMSLESIRLLPLVTRIMESVEPRALDKGTSVTVEIDEALEVRADAKALEQVLVNLVDNAIKYTPRDGAVCIRALHDDGAVQIEVEDDGPGIDAAHRARVFERFFRVDPGRSRDMGGTGLGLSIVKHLAEAMGGTTGLRPRSPNGSIFWVRLDAG